jgi:hypothetical protein
MALEDGIVLDVFRWRVLATYRTDQGPLEVEHFVEELAELHALIERGPNWDALIDIKVTINPRRANYAGLTVERSLDL